MPRSKEETKILVVTDNPNAPREYAQLLGNDEPVRALFADTGNAVQRTFENDPIDLVIVEVDSADLPLFEAASKLSQENRPPLPVVAIVDSEDIQAVLKAAECGTEGIAFAGDTRTIKRLLEFVAASVRDRRDASTALKRLEEIESRYTLLLDSSNESIAYIHEGLHIYANRAYLESFGYPDFDELEGLSMLDLLSAEDPEVDLKQILKALSRDEIPEEEISLKAHRNDGSEFNVSVAFSPARYGGEYCAQMLIREIRSEDNSAMAAELEKLKTVDLITGFLNRRSFIERIRAELESSEDTSRLGLVLCTLDKYQDMQTKVGFGAADQLIRAVGELFKQALPEHLLIGRINDRTFGIFIEVESREQAEAATAGLIDFCSGRIIEVGETSLTVSASAGLTIVGADAHSSEQIVAQADNALGEALHAGGNAYVRYRPRVSADGDEDLAAWDEKIRHALEHEEFRLITSPITSMDDDEFLINEIESRLRSEDSDEVLMSSVFMPAASKLGLAPRLDQDLLRRLLASIGGRTPEGGERWLVPITMATIGEQSVVQSMLGMLKQKEVDPARIIWGIRVSEVEDKLRPAQGFIEMAKAMESHIALYDIGPETRIEPLLKNLEIDFLRLAPEMVQNMSGNEAIKKQLAELVEHANEYKARVIAPKVEHTGDLATLWQFGITLVQGDFVREEAGAA